MSPTELAIAALATWQAVEVWRHSELLAGLRARSELYDNIITRALACPFCLSVWVALMVVGLLLLPCPAWQNPGPGLWPTLRAEPVFGEHLFGTLQAVFAILAYIIVLAANTLFVVGKIAVYALAVSRLANLGNDLTYDYNRTPKPNFKEQQDGDSGSPDV